MTVFNSQFFGRLMRANQFYFLCLLNEYCYCVLVMRYALYINIWYVCVSLAIGADNSIPLHSPSCPFHSCSYISLLFDVIFSSTSTMPTKAYREQDALLALALHELRIDSKWMAQSNRFCVHNDDTRADRFYYTTGITQAHVCVL